MPNSFLAASPNSSIANSSATLALTEGAVVPILQGLMAGRGWRNLRAEIFARDQEAAIKLADLQQALTDYNKDSSSQVYQANLVNLLKEELIAVQAEYDYVQTKLLEFNQEATFAIQWSQSQGWGQWLVSKVKFFFASTPEQQIERYTALLTKKQIYMDQLHFTLANLRQSPKEKSRLAAASVDEDGLTPMNLQMQKTAAVIKKSVRRADQNKKLKSTTRFELLAKESTEFHVDNNTYLLGDQFSPAITSFTNGGFVIIWSGNSKKPLERGLRFQRYNALANKVRGEIQITSNLGENDRSVASIASLSNDNFVVAYKTTYENLGGYAQSIGVKIYNSSGYPADSRGINEAVNLQSIGIPKITPLVDNSFVLTWCSDGGYGIYIQKFTGMGNEISGQQRVNTNVIYPQNSPAIAANKNGDLMLVWSGSEPGSSGYEIYAQRFNSFPVKIGGEFIVNTYQTGNQDSPVIISLNNGQFVVAWVSTDGVAHAIFAQKMDAVGNKIGAEFQVNSLGYNQSSAIAPNMAALINGDFIVTWSSLFQDGYGYGIYAQRFSILGDKIGEEFQVNSYTKYNQLNPAVAALPDGGFIITWASNKNLAYGSGIYGQRFAVDGGKIKINGESPKEQFTLSSTALILIGVAAGSVACCGMGYCLCKSSSTSSKETRAVQNSSEAPQVMPKQEIKNSPPPLTVTKPAWIKEEAIEIPPVAPLSHTVFFEAPQATDDYDAMRQREKKEEEEREQQVQLEVRKIRAQEQIDKEYREYTGADEHNVDRLKRDYHNAVRQYRDDFNEEPVHREYVENSCQIM